jgi:PKD repeat protein
MAATQTRHQLQHMKKTVNTQAPSKSCKKHITTAFAVVGIILAYIGTSGIGPSLLDRFWPSDNKPPSAKITEMKQEGIIPFEVIFNGAKSLDPEGNTLTFQWIIDDKVISTKESFRYRFDSPGKYNVVLEVKDDTGKINKDNIIITASISKEMPMQPPVKPVKVKNDNRIEKIINKKTSNLMKYKVTVYSPEKSSIYINGKHFGDTILHIDLNEGTHEFLVRKNDVAWKTTEYINRERFFNIREEEMN